MIMYSIFLRNAQAYFAFIARPAEVADPLLEAVYKRIRESRLGISPSMGGSQKPP